MVSRPYKTQAQAYQTQAYLGLGEARLPFGEWVKEGFRGEYGPGANFPKGGNWVDTAGYHVGAYIKGLFNRLISTGLNEAQKKNAEAMLDAFFGDRPIPGSVYYENGHRKTDYTPDQLRGLCVQNCKNHYPGTTPVMSATNSCFCKKPGAITVSCGYKPVSGEPNCSYDACKKASCWRNVPCGQSQPKSWCAYGGCGNAKNAWLGQYNCKTGAAATGCRQINSNCFYCNYGGAKKGYCWRNRICNSSQVKGWCTQGSTSCDQARRVWSSRYACKSSGGGTSGISPAPAEKLGCRYVRSHCYYCNYGGDKKGYCWKNVKCGGGTRAWCVKGSRTCTTAMNVWARLYGCKRSSSGGGGSSGGSSGGIIKTGCGCSHYPKCNNYLASTCKNCCLSNCRAKCNTLYKSKPGTIDPHTKSGHCYCNYKP